MIDRSAPQPQGLYVPARRHRDMIFVSGMTPRENGKLLYAGQVGLGTPVETYRMAVELAAENALTAAKSQLLAGEQLSVLSLTVYVNAPVGYTLHSRVADFASRFLEEHSNGGVSSRAAIGVSSLPGDATFEISIVAAADRCSPLLVVGRVS
ncbi:RidA family protein [Sinorhizobium meliloti]|uniref:RidA family protein n=1 Tax=Rhizobium meliloti TaxID=382 RepID=UPI000FDB9482|nr:RidA family protein [Sinorhizobium meliloti]MDW9364332.1 RidA family protein [Sinorhizobium meliloti]MDW9389073.1 RidA family protein [Sinorhizobium meliloti]MDW9394854.1 RidA family protein [Sinorhizobium meliloti]MDW9546536.1 RidA family protein [Sinorhizobium meliloti]RVK36198.1 RidA family protein [Sinorhizobium meliloti]